MLGLGGERCAGEHRPRASEERAPVHHLTCTRESLGGERRSKEHRPVASEKRAPIHYWITSSARWSSDGGIVRPSALAVLRLIASSNLLGRSTGNSPALAPLRILST